MQKNSVTSTNFGALNVSKVAHADKRYVRANKKALEQLGESFDINIKSGIDKDGYHGALKIVAKPLAEGMNFLQKLTRKSGTSYSRIPANDIVEQTQNAINNLRKKVLLEKVK